MVKVASVNSEELTFDDGSKLFSEHGQDCYESHFLSFTDLSIRDFDGMDFDLSGDTFFEKVEGFGIRLIPIVGHPISVPGYGYNNGYYSSDLTLVLVSPGIRREFDISECQEIGG